MSSSILGGTFERLHAGHLALLREAAKSGHVLAGLTSDEWARKNGKKKVAPYAARERALRRALRTLLPASRFTIFELNDAFGPALFDCGADTLVVSQETQKTAEEINKKRRASGLSPLRVSVVPLVPAQDGLPISSSRIAQKRIDAQGRRRVPLRVAVGSANPSKLRGVKKALQRAFPGLRAPAFSVRGLPVPSGVHEQPVGFDLIWKGALNRALAAVKKWPACDYAIGLESGLLPLGNQYYDVQFCALLDAGGRATSGSSMGFPLPKRMEEEIFGSGLRRTLCPRPIRSLGDAAARLSGLDDIGRKKGALHFLSRGLLERSEMTEQAVLCALVERRSPVYGCIRACVWRNHFYLLACYPPLCLFSS